MVKLLSGISFVIFIGLLIIPTFQQLYNFFDIRPLKGSYVLASQPDLKYFTWQRWFDQDFQQVTEKRINDHIGFRSLFIRLYNQVDYNVFEKINENNVRRGKKGYLFASSYINAYYGLDYAGEIYINRQSNKLKILQDTLQKVGKLFFVVLAPGKGSFYNEYLPGGNLPIKRTTTNYEMFARKFNELNFKYLDFKSLFGRLKATSEFALFPKCGIHWSTYGAAIAGDSLIRFIDSNSIFRLPDFKMNVFPIGDSSKYSGLDYDIASGMNLLCKIKQPRIGRVELDFPDQDIFKKPEALVVGDSYYYSIARLGIPEFYFKNYRFWYYNKDVQVAVQEKGKDVSNYDLKDEIKKSDIIFIITTDANLWKFPFHFTDDLIDLFFPTDEMYLKYYQRLCKLDKSVETSYSEYFSKDTSGILLQNFRADKKRKDSLLKAQRIDMYIREIRNSPFLLNMIIDKMKKRKSYLGLDSMIRGDATWLYENENKN